MYAYLKFNKRFKPFFHLLSLNLYKRLMGILATTY